MRDPRLQQAWEAARDARLCAARNRLDEMVTAEERAGICSVLTDWWAYVLAEDSEGEQWRDEKFENLRIRCFSLSNTSKEVALAALDAMTCVAAEKAYGVGPVLLGESAAVVVRRGSVADLDRAVELLSDCWDAVHVLVDRLMNDPPWPPDLATLVPEMIDIRGALIQHSERLLSNDLLMKEEKEAREGGVFSYFWGRYPEAYLNEKALVRYTLLARRDFNELSIQVDALPLRGLRDHLWSSVHIHEDRDLILDLLNVAPDVFQGSIWTGSTSALIALRSAMQFVCGVHEKLEQDVRAYRAPSGAKDNLDKFIENDVSEWMRKVADVAMLRSDGRLLLLIFGFSLVRDSMRPSWGGIPRWSPAQDALAAICDVLDPTPSIGEVMRSGEVAGVMSGSADYDGGALLVLSALLKSCTNDVWSWYRDLLIGRDKSLCNQARNWRRNMCFKSISESLSNFPDPFLEWRNSWNSIFITDREHARFFPLDKDILYPSLHLIRVAEELLRQDSSRLGAKTFFSDIFTLKRYLLELDAGLLEYSHPLLSIEGIDIAPIIYGDDWGSFLEDFRYLLTTAESRIYASVYLLQGGARFSDIENFFEIDGHGIMSSVGEVLSHSKTDARMQKLCDFIEAAKNGKEL